MNEIGKRQPPCYLNRTYSDGLAMDADKAMIEFPDLDVNPDSHRCEISANGIAELRYYGMRFSVHSIIPSVEQGTYFGEIIDSLPSNLAGLDCDQTIDFELRHVFAVTSGEVRKANASKR